MVGRDMKQKYFYQKSTCIIKINFIICLYANIFCNFYMKKRKLDVNEIKKLTLRSKQSRTITTKYQVVLSFFKEKNEKSNRIFTIELENLIADFLDQLSNAEITYKLEKSLSGEIHTVEVDKNALKIDTGCLKYVCKEFPIKQIVECIEIKKSPTNKKVSLEVNNSKLMVFFKHLRNIFSQFCSSAGEKIIVENYDLRSFYDTFKCEWNKLHERGRMDACQKIEKLLCRSLYFIGALIENNIFSEIQSQERVKKEEAADIGTRSQKKRDIKGINYQISSTYSFGGDIDLLSNFSSCIHSQKSNQQVFCRTGEGYSQKSQRFPKKERNCILWDKVQIKNLKIQLIPQQKSENVPQINKFQINLLSNDVENLLIQQAFKIKRLKDEWNRNRNIQQNSYIYPHYGGYYPHFYQNYSSNYINTEISGIQDNASVHNKRNFNYINLVETRKSHSRLENSKYS